MFRAYCWRIGGIVDLEPGERCPECGSPKHEPYTPDNCGSFAPCEDMSTSHGHPCNLPIGHPGLCMCWPCNKPKIDVIHEEILES